MSKNKSEHLPSTSPGFLYLCILSTNSAILASCSGSITSSTTNSKSNLRIGIYWGLGCVNKDLSDDLDKD